MVKRQAPIDPWLSPSPLLVNFTLFPLNWLPPPFYHHGSTATHVPSLHCRVDSALPGDCHHVCSPQGLECKLRGQLSLVTACEAFRTSIPCFPLLLPRVCAQHRDQRLCLPLQNKQLTRIGHVRAEVQPIQTHQGHRRRSYPNHETASGVWAIHIPPSFTEFQDPVQDHVSYPTQSHLPLPLANRCYTGRTTCNRQFRNYAQTNESHPCLFRAWRLARGGWLVAYPKYGYSYLVDVVQQVHF